MNKQDEILNYLIQQSLINFQQLAEVKETAETTNKKAEEILINKKFIDEEDLAKAKAEINNIPYENLADKNINDEVMRVIPVEVSENYKIICFEKKENLIKIGIVDPDNYKAIEAVNFLAKEENYKAEYYLISNFSFNSAFKQYRNLKKEVISALKIKEEEETDRREMVKKKEGVKLEDITKTAPVAKIVSVIIRHAVEGRASDIHIEPLPKESRVRYRIDGILGTSLILPKNIHDAIIGRIKVLANLKLDETRMPQDGRIRLNVEGREIDLRVSTLPLIGEEKIVMRILDINKKIINLEDLGFISDSLKIIKNNIKKTEGMFLVTGPTGSGKSTTIFSILNIINKEKVNISTLEDPVEYFIEGINQSQVKPEIGYTFASGLRSILRQDPDVVMVGEIRDNETAELAVHAGLTGHFVLSTLHTNDALGAIPRLFDMKVEPFLLGSTLNTVVAQRLVRRICFYCEKIEDHIPPDVLSDIKKEIDNIPMEVLKEFFPDFDKNKMKFYRGGGCSRCGNIGYNERMVVAEVIDINEDLKNIIVNGKRLINLEDIKRGQKFITLKQDGLLKALLGQTTVEEVLRVAYD